MLILDILSNGLWGTLQLPDSTVQCVIRGALYVPVMKNKTNTTLISQSGTVQSLQPSLKPLHTVTCGELWRGNKTNHPVHSLSSMWGRCIDLRALLYKKERNTLHNTAWFYFDPALSEKGLLAWKAWFPCRWWQASFAVTLEIKPLDFLRVSRASVLCSPWCQQKWRAWLW